jgi:hypothetical protein
MNDNISSLLDSNLDDLADLPEFVVPPAGAYNATILSIEKKEIGEHPAVEMKFKLNETMELASASDAPVAAGTECGVSFMLDNEFGVGSMKAALKPLQVAFGTNSVRETMEAAKGANIMLVTKVRNGKGDKADKKYLGVQKIEVL